MSEDRNAPDFYRLPEGWTWARVAEERAKWDIGERLFPLAAVAGVVTAWGVPLPGDQEEAAPPKGECHENHTA